MRRAGTAVLTLTAQHFLSLALKMMANLTLTRILAPDAFGLMSLALSITAALVLLSDAGTLQSIVANPRGREAAFLNTAWTIHIIRGTCLSAAAALAAAYLHRHTAPSLSETSTVYSDPRLPAILVAFGGILFLSGFESTKIAEAQRAMRLSRLVVLDLIAQTSAVLVMIISAHLWQSVWSLVLGAYTSTIIKTTGSHVFLLGTKNRIFWDRGAFNEIVKFGRWLILSSALVFAAQNGDKLLLAGATTTSSLGLYAIATLWLAVPQGLFSSLVSAVAFPSLSAAAASSDRALKDEYCRLQNQADLFLLSAAGVLATASPALIRLLYSDQFHGSGPMLSTLAIGLIGSRYAIVEQLYYCYGQTRLIATANFLRSLVLLVALPIALRLSELEGFLAAVVLSQFAGWLVSIPFKYRHRLFCMQELYALFVFIPSALLGYLLTVVLDTIGANLTDVY